MLAVIRLSDTIYTVERRALMTMVALVLGLMVVNVASRAIDLSLYWADEAAINMMVVFAFVGSSMMFRRRANFAVTILSEMLSPRGQHRLSLVVQMVNVAFALLMIFTAWLWFDPWTLAQHQFDTEAFFKATFNSVYKEITTTIGIRRVWFFLIMPWFGLSLLVHSLACLSEEIRRVEPPEEGNALEG